MCNHDVLYGGFDDKGNPFIAKQLPEPEPRKTLSDLTAFSRRILTGQEDGAQQVTVALVDATAELTEELILGHTDHITADLLSDVLYALSGVAVLAGKDLEQIVHAGVIEREAKLKTMEAAQSGDIDAIISLLGL